MKIKLIVSFIMIVGHMVTMGSEQLVKYDRKFIEGLPLEIYARIFSYMIEVPIGKIERKTNDFSKSFKAKNEERIKLLMFCNDYNLSKKIYDNLKDYPSIQGYRESNQGVLTKKLVFKNINSFSTLEECLRMGSLNQQPILKKDQVLSLNNALMQLPGNAYGDHTIKYECCTSLTIANFNRYENLKVLCTWGLFLFSTSLISSLIAQNKDCFFEICHQDTVDKNEVREFINMMLRYKALQTRNPIWLSELLSKQEPLFLPNVYGIAKIMVHFALFPIIKFMLTGSFDDFEGKLVATMIGFISILSEVFSAHLFNLPLLIPLLLLGVSVSWRIISMIYYRIIPKEATISVKNISKSLNDPDIIIQ